MVLYKLTKADNEALVEIRGLGKHWTTIDPELQLRIATLQLHGYCAGIWSVDGLFKLTRLGAMSVAQYQMQQALQPS